MMGRLAKIAGLVACLLLGCESGHMDSFAIVEDLRIMGLASEPPEVIRGEPISHQVLWADPSGLGRQVWFAWQTYRFVYEEGETTMIGRPIHPTRFIWAKDGGDTFQTPKEATVTAVETDMVEIWVEVFMCASDHIPGQSFFMGNVVSEQFCDGHAFSAQRRLNLRDPEFPQSNPRIDRLLLDGQPLEPKPGGESFELTCPKNKCEKTVVLSAFFSEDQFEPYEQQVGQDELEEVTEYLYVSFYATGGHMGQSDLATDDPQQSVTRQWEITEPGTYSLWAVAHDSRGGTSWETYEIVVLR